MKIAKDNTNSNTKKWKKSLLKILWILYAIFSIVVLFLGTATSGVVLTLEELSWNLMLSKYGWFTKISK